MYIFTNNKTEGMYNKVYKIVYNILSQKHICPLKVKYIITDTEIAIMYGINNNKNIKRIGAIFI